jgi:NADPH:quinone reductase-like Zn-dependent oxidoreductase
MRAMQVPAWGAEIVEAEVAEPRPAGEKVRVRVAAATVNPVDPVTAAGVFRERFPEIQPPFVLGWDFAGTLLDDTDQADLKAGQRVIGMVPWFDQPSGSYQEVLLAEPSWLAPIPDTVDFIEAATLPLNAPTARQGLHLAAVRPGQTVLVSGASGGVGGFAVQAAVAAGARVIAISSADDADYVKTLGPAEVLPRTGWPALRDQIKNLAPAGVDAVVDAGVAGPDLIDVVRDGGVFVNFSQPAAPAPERGIRVELTHVIPDPVGLRRVVDDVATNGLKTRVADVRPLSEAARAHQRLHAGGFHGKIVLEV